MNLDTLEYLLRDGEEIIRESARENGVNEESAIGVAKKVIGERSAVGLIGKQPYVFEKAILPLIENVSCIGWFDEYDGDNGSNFDCKAHIEEARLTHCYREDRMRCESCEEEEDYRAARKADYMRE